MPKKIAANGDGVVAADQHHHFHPKGDHHYPLQAHHLQDSLTALALGSQLQLNSSSSSSSAGDPAANTAFALDHNQNSTTRFIAAPTADNAAIADRAMGGQRQTNAAGVGVGGPGAASTHGDKN